MILPPINFKKWIDGNRHLFKLPVYSQLIIDDVGISELEHKDIYTCAFINIDKRLKFDPTHPPAIKKFVFTIARLGGFTNLSN